MLSHAALIGRIVGGAALGGVIGYERDRHGRPAGLRTHVIVAMASATFMVVSSQFVYLQHYGKEDLVAVDTSRIAASVVSGIGFLAGGAILRSGPTIQGLTTGAGLWLVTAVGLCSGSGMYVEAAVATALGVIALTLLRRFEDKDDQTIRRRITVVMGDAGATSADLVAAINAVGGSVADLDYDKRFDDKKKVALSLEVRLPARVGLPRLIDVLESQPGVRRIQVRAVTS
jgi:putative Mg2+ transporter-C (MgtC) family protein